MLSKFIKARFELKKNKLKAYPRGGAGLYYQYLFLPPPFLLDRERETDRKRERER